MKSKRKKNPRPQSKRNHPAAVQADVKPPMPGALLVSRMQARGLLGCSLKVLKGLQARGALDAVKLNPDSPSSKTYYRVEQVNALAQGRAEA